MSFTVDRQHIALLGRTYTTWMDDYYLGAPGVDPKRPFGNSDIERDIYEIIYKGRTPEGVDPDQFWDTFNPDDHPELYERFREMEYVVQIALQCASRGEPMTVGEYSRVEEYDTRVWRKV